LVTGLNGIRKTTSVYQPWFADVLRTASVQWAADGEYDERTMGPVPVGGTCFFRQLDFMIATLANTQFERLYTEVDEDDVETYSKFKDAIFARYRTLAETLGVLLVRAAQRAGISVMVETSGRDVGMYEYVEHLFSPAACTDYTYKKLVVNFGVSDIKHAEASVDARMRREMALGRAA